MKICNQIGRMKKLVLCTVGLLLALGTMAQTAADGSIVRWFDPLKAGFPVVQGQAWPQELSGNYHRLPDRMQPVMDKRYI